VPLIVQKLVVVSENPDHVCREEGLQGFFLMLSSSSFAWMSFSADQIHSHC